MKRKVEIIQDAEKPMAVEVLAESIKAISDGMKRMRVGPLNDKALVLLIQASAKTNPKLTQLEIGAVLDAIDDLATTYLRKPMSK